MSGARDVVNVTDGDGDDQAVSAPKTWLSSALTPGTLINDRYRVDAVLGRGAMGVVVAGEHLHLRERVALKFLLRSGSAGGADFAARFLREAKVCAKLKNEHITRVVDFGEWHDALFMVMEYLEGSDLRYVLKTAGRLPVEQAVNYAVQMCVGLAEAHARGIVHRDLKPSNVFIVRGVDGSDFVKILDFGVSKERTASAMDGGVVEEGTETGFLLGSPKYMAPEQIFDPRAVGPRSDVWAIGAVVYEMLSGRRPFEAPSFPAAIALLSAEKGPAPLFGDVPGVSPALELVVMRCLVKSVSERMPDVATLAGDLLETMGDPAARAVRARLEAILTTGAGRSQSPDGVTAFPPPGDGSFSSVGAQGSGAPFSSAGRRTAAALVAPRRRARAVVAVLAVLAMLLVAVLLVRARHIESPAPVVADLQARPDSAPSPSVRVAIHATPSEAVIAIDGQLRGVGSVRLDVTSDAQDHLVRISAPGYTTAERTARFSADLQMDIALDKAPVAATSTTATPATGAAARTPPRPAPAPWPPPPRPVVPPPNVAATATSGCSPPYYFANGIKTYRPECL